MVSLQKALSTKERSMNWLAIISGDPSKKRKREQDDSEGEVHAAAKELKLWCNSKSDPPPSDGDVVDDIELQLGDSPLPPEWQRCLDIQSGRIHFYNTRTQKRTTRDPRQSPEPPSSRPPLSLDLELNLCRESPATKKEEEEDEEEEEEKDQKQQRHEKKQELGVLPRASGEVDCREMMATVCMQCHMLVMMCRSTPLCPNCRFLHPTPDKVAAAPALTKPGIRLQRYAAKSTRRK